MNALLVGLTILVIGDSHLSSPGYLIDSLHNSLMAQGAQVYSYGACGVAAGDWAHTAQSSCGGASRINNGPLRLLKGSAAATTPIKDLIAEHNPNLVVIVIGDTMAAYNQPDFSRTWIWQQVTTLTKGIKGTGVSCAWVGPAWGSEGGKFQKTFSRVKQVSAYLSEIVAPCIYIDSLAMSRQGEWATFDGQHFTESGYKLWASGISKAISSPAVLGAIKR